MSDFVWETFDGLFKTVNRQERRVKALEARILELEQRLNEREQRTSNHSASVQAAPSASTTLSAVNHEMPAERAA